MPTNDYQTWAVGSGANVEPQSTFVSDPVRNNGEVSGKANSPRANKVWRQSSMWSVALGMFLNDQGHDALDDGVPANLFTSLKSSILSWITAASGLPPGVMVQFAGGAAPSGWLLCDGSAVSRTTYANLFAVLGATYGAGDGSATFNLPDGRSRVLAGRDAGNATGRLTGNTAQGVSASSLGNVGGEQSHVSTSAEMPSHTHGVSDPTHTHGVNDPTHSHGISDPTHTHGVNDPSHAHSVADPSHTHGVGDSGHAHSTYADGTSRSVGNAGGPITGIGNYNPGASVGVSGSGISIAYAGTGLGIYANYTGIYLSYGGTNISIYGAYTGIGLTYSGTGISIASNGGNAGHNNTQPTLIVNHIIKT